MVRHKALAIAVLIVLTSGGVSLSSAPAHADSKAKAKIYLTKADCGLPNKDFKAIGNAQLRRDLINIYVTVKLSKAPPNSSGDVELWTGGFPSCYRVAELGTYSTDAKGKTTFEGARKVGESITEIFVALRQSGGGYHDSPTFTLRP